MLYIYDFMCWAWTLKHIIDEMFFVEQGAVENMAIWCLCWVRISGAHECLYLCWTGISGKHELWKPLCWAWSFEAHKKIKLEVLGISPGAFQVDVEHNIWNIRSLAIVSLGVSYKYILALVLSKELWNCTKFVTPCFLALSMGSG